MKGKRIILFDLDGTLFDYKGFLDDLFKILSNDFNLDEEDILKIKSIYEENKNQFGYFNPEPFLIEIANTFSISLQLLTGIFWNVDLFEKNVYKDTSVIENLSNVVRIGIFSKGDRDFQKKKLISLKNYIADEDIFIFPEKIDKISETLYKYKDFQVFIVDNEIEVLIKIKNLFPKIETILVDRKNIYQETNKILRIKTLEDLKSIIYD